MRQHVFLKYTCDNTCAMSEELGKKKLTLTVDEKVIEKAKSLGFNLSEVTESVLRSFAFQPTKADTDQVYRKYAELFESMKPLLQQYGTGVSIGSVPQKPFEIDGKESQPPDLDLYLGSDGQVYLEDFEEPFKDIHGVELWQLSTPKQILANFVSSLSEAQERRKEKIGELEMARRIVEAMTEGVRPNSLQKKAKTKT